MLTVGKAFTVIVVPPELVQPLESVPVALNVVVVVGDTVLGLSVLPSFHT